MVQYLYNSGGEWIAFRDGDYIYAASGEFLGYLAQDRINVVGFEGRYFGTIYGERLFRKVLPPRVEALFPGYPGQHTQPEFPGLAGSVPLPLDAEEISELVPA